VVVARKILQTKERNGKNPSFRLLLQSHIPSRVYFISFTDSLHSARLILHEHETGCKCNDGGSPCTRNTLYFSLITISHKALL
jgi:hypothetical protein